MKKIIEKIGFVLLCLAIFFGVQVTFATAIVFHAPGNVKGKVCVRWRQMHAHIARKC